MLIRMSNTISFQFSGLRADAFSHLIGMPDAELAAIGAQRVIAHESPGYPCRVSLDEAQVGERVLLLRHVHQPGDSPYQASGPIFVREAAAPAQLGVDEVPVVVARRLVSLRAYDAAHIMIDADICPGREIAPLIQRMFAQADVAYIHVHNAARGCYSSRIDRVAV